jgi:hypothetical protein
MDVNAASRIIDIFSPAVGEDYDATPPMTAWNPSGEKVSPSGNPHSDLVNMRADFPFVPIFPVPDDVVSVVCVNPNTAVSPASSYDVTLPSGTTVIAFEADGNDFYVNFDGNALNPSIVAVGNDPTSDNNRCQSLFAPRNRFWYVGALHQLSVSSPTPNRIVQVWCWFTKHRNAR